MHPKAFTRRSDFAAVLPLLLAIFLTLGADPGSVRAASVREEAQTAAQNAQTAVTDASREVASSFDQMWHRVSESRLKNRTRDELVAWVIMGLLVGSLAGMLTSLRPTGLGLVGRILLGLAGAFLGGLVAHVTRIDFGFGPVLIRYEELLFSLAGAILLVVIVRLFRRASAKKRA